MYGNSYYSNQQRLPTNHPPGGGEGPRNAKSFSIVSVELNTQLFDKVTKGYTDRKTLQTVEGRAMERSTSIIKIHNPNIKVVHNQWKNAPQSIQLISSVAHLSLFYSPRLQTQMKIWLKNITRSTDRFTRYSLFLMNLTYCLLTKQNK